MSSNDTVYNYFSTSGSGYNRWYVTGFTDYTKIYDEEPQLISVAPMAGGTYQVGDAFTVALIFNEIVDSQNSPNIDSVAVITNWGTATYQGGADTMFFTLKVPSGRTRQAIWL